MCSGEEVGMAQNLGIGASRGAKARNWCSEYPWIGEKPLGEALSGAFLGCIENDCTKIETLRQI